MPVVISGARSSFTWELPLSTGTYRVSADAIPVRYGAVAHIDPVTRACGYHPAVGAAELDADLRAVGGRYLAGEHWLTKKEAIKHAAPASATELCVLVAIPAPVPLATGGRTVRDG
jgi:hypothetical protein